MKVSNIFICYVLFIILHLPNLLSQGIGKARFFGVVQDLDGQPVEGIQVFASFLGNLNRKDYIYRNKEINLEKVNVHFVLETVTDKSGKWFITGIGTGFWKLEAFFNDIRVASKFIYTRQLQSHQNVVQYRNRIFLIGKEESFDLLIVHREVNRFLGDWVIKGIGSKHCEKLKGIQKKTCYQVLANVHFKKKIEKWLKKGEVERADSCCQNADQKLSQECYRILTRVLLRRKEFKKALQCFQKGGIHAPERARTNMLLAKEYLLQGKRILAKNCFLSAVKEYNFLIKTWDYKWNKRDRKNRRICFEELKNFEKSPEEKAEQDLLKRLLKKSAKYCFRLKNTFLYFICFENINEITSRSKRGFNQNHITSDAHGSIQIRSASIKKNKMVYDYRLIQKDQEIKETRALVRKDGRKKNVDGSSLLTHRYIFKKIIFGPIEILSDYWQDYYCFSIDKQERLMEKKVVVIDAVPRSIISDNFLFGKIWIKEEPFQILKIEWNPKSIRNFRTVMENLSKKNADPYINYFTEFGITKRRVCFPSRCYLEIGYINEQGEKYVDLLANILYKDYLFYNVGAKVLKEEVGRGRK